MLRGLFPDASQDLSQPCCRVSHRAAGPGSTSRAQSRGQGQLLRFCPGVSCSWGQTQAPQRRPQPKARPDVRGDPRERKPLEAARAWVHGTAASRHIRLSRVPGVAEPRTQLSPGGGCTAAAEAGEASQPSQPGGATGVTHRLWGAPAPTNPDGCPGQEVGHGKARAGE